MLLLISDSHRELSGSRIKKPEREERRRRRDPLFRAPIRKFFGRSFQEEPFVPLITSLIYLFNSPQERERERKILFSCLVESFNRVQVLFDVVPLRPSKNHILPSAFFLSPSRSFSSDQRENQRVYYACAIAFSF